MKRIGPPVAAVAMLAMAAPAPAARLDRVMANPPLAVFSSNKPLFAVEQCIVLFDYAAAPHVYRTPDAADESLIFWTTGGVGSPPVIRLDKQGGAVRVSLWEAGGKLQQIVAACL